MGLVPLSGSESALTPSPSGEDPAEGWAVYEPGSDASPDTESVEPQSQTSQCQKLGNECLLFKPASVC